MNFEEVKKYIDENKGDKELAAYLQGLMGVEGMQKYLAENEDGRRWLDAEKDKHLDKGLKTWKDNNLQKEIDKKIIFLRKLERGGSAHSFGIHVAKMAGMPHSIVKRSERILKQLENDNRQTGIAKPVGEIATQREGYQLSFFQLDDPVLEQVRDEIKGLDVNNLTPIDALNKLNEIKRIITGK